MASSSSSLIIQAKYDVFLNFRGEDTRENITSHLYAALCRKKIQTFIDDDGLKRGDEISLRLLKAIEESKISVIIFSKAYASSRWCLDELVKILECKEKNHQIVIPVFYHVNPSDVRRQTGCFGEAFSKHEEGFKEIMTDKVQKWRTALTEAANLSGWDSMVIRPESKLVEKVVEVISKKLSDMSTSSDHEGLVGVTSRVEKIKSLLCIGLLDFRVIGIWGMGGIGKTTLAGVIYDQVSTQFEGHCFSINVREESEKYGLIHVRDQVISQILGEKVKIRTPSISQYIRERIRYKRVLIVLDDINTIGQLELLVGGLDKFGLGSRIIITTRNKQVLKSYGVSHIYEVEGLNYNEALQLFYICAFKQKHPLGDFVELSNKVIDYAKENPLALKVLGSSLYEKSKQDWESAVSNLKVINDTQIHEVLKISYERLNREEKNIFLDIACFFKGENRDRVTNILDGCYNFSTHICLTTLIDKSLILESEENELEMHDLLQEMGQEIVYQESNKNSSEHSRLWYHDDIYRLLLENKGTYSIEGIFLNMSKIRDLSLSSRAFSKMTNLRLLKFYNHELYEDTMVTSKVHLPQGLEYLSNELRYLQWDGYPLKKLPSKFSFKNIVELVLPNSKLKQLWKGTKRPTKLIFIDLHDSQHLIEIPNLSDAIGLEVINLQNCRSLVNVHPSIQCLKKLHRLKLRGCESFRSFSGNIHFRSPITLDLSKCSKLKKFPQISGNIRYLYLSETAVEEVPPSIECLTMLVGLDMQKCIRIKWLSTNIFKLKSLKWLNLSDCSKLESLPEILEEMECLESLQLNGATTIQELPSSIEYLKGLVDLGLRECKNLKSIPRSICNLTSLKSIDISGCSKIDKLPENLGNLICLQKLNASKTPISEFPFSMIACNKQISILKLALCNLSEIPEDLCCLSSLNILDLSGNSFKSLPQSIKQLLQLTSLQMNNCHMLQSLPELPMYLKELYAVNCQQLRSLPMISSSLEEQDTSDLRRPHYDPSFFFLNSHNFVFTNCLKLNADNQVLAEAQLMFQHMATASLTYRYDKVSDQAPAFCFCLPGSEIPDWFSNQSSGSVLTIELSQYWFNPRFIGFVLCIVIDFEESYYDDNLQIRCASLFRTKYGHKIVYNHIWPISLSKVLIETEHVLLGYYPNFFPEIIGGEYKTVSFNFFPHRLSKGCFEMAPGKIKCCGACPLYVEPKTDQPNISTENFATTGKDFGEAVEHSDTNGCGPCGSGTSEEEETEVPQVNAPMINNEVPSFYHILCTNGGLFLSCCGTLVVYFFCGLCVLWLLELFGTL